LKSLSVPPLTAMSAGVKSVEGSLSAKASVAVSPAASAVRSVVMAIVGATTSRSQTGEVAELLTTSAVPSPSV